MDFMSFLTIVIGISFILYISKRIIKMQRRVAKNKKYIKVVDVLNDDELFFKEVDEYLLKADDEYRTKALILKLYATVKYGYDGFEEILEQIDLNKLMELKNKYDYDTMSYNEDSFYYFGVLIPVKLYHLNQLEKVKLIENKYKEVCTKVENQLFYDIYKNSLKLYFEEDDLGYDFFSKVCNGEYNGQYAKQMIGIYKSASACFLGKIMIIKNIEDTEDLITSDLSHYSKSRNGYRMMMDLDILNRFGEN